MAKPKGLDSARMRDRRAAIKGEQFMFRGEQHTVAEKSEGQSGQWMCIACGLALDNNLAKDLHCGKRPKIVYGRITRALGPVGGRFHVLAWRSFVSGKVEAP